jgi:hypothetical protein
MDLGDLEQRTAKKKELIEENIQRHQEVLNRIFDSEDGRFFYKVLVKYCGIFSIDNNVNDDTLRENIGKRKVLLELILPYLDKDVRTGLHD